MKTLLLFLSKTDQTIIGRCPQSAVNNQIALGIFVLLTGIFAFLSGTYAISTLFAEYDTETHAPVVNTLGYVKAGFIGCIYSFMIMAIDREIVAATNKVAMIFRLPIAAVVGLTIAVPMEMKLFEGRIDKQLLIRFQKDNLPAANSRNKIITEYKNKEEVLEERLVKARDRVVDITDKLDQEETGAKVLGRSQKIGRGPAFRQLQENLQLAKQDVATAEYEMHEFQKKEPEAIVTASSTYKRDSIPQSYDFLSRYEALSEITSQSGSANRMSWGISFLFFFLELTPALIKLLLKPSEYDILIETRRRLNIQMTHSVGNAGMEEMETEIENTKSPDYLIRIKEAMMR